MQEKISKQDLAAAILKLKKEKNAVIMAHYYQAPEVQDIADVLGDSLALAQKAVAIDAPIIVLAGVRFMAETAKILNPSKKVLLPDISAGCSLADGCSASRYAEFIKKYPAHVRISYVNCSVEIKAMSDILCTSSNALKVINSVPQDKPILFGPDRNLGAYLQQQTGREMLLWDACCEVHQGFEAKDLKKIKSENPTAAVLAHPECQADVLSLADVIGSTSALLKYTKENEGPFIIVTEKGIIHQMKSASPEKVFLTPYNTFSEGEATCKEMQKSNLETLYQCLKNETPAIEIPYQLQEKALQALERMLEV